MLVGHGGGKGVRKFLRRTWPDLPRAEFRLVHGVRGQDMEVTGVDDGSVGSTPALSVAGRLPMERTRGPVVPTRGRLLVSLGLGEGRAKWTATQVDPRLDTSAGNRGGIGGGV
ncbi:hypothetical protein R1flu_027644 [Riccia fluitans]|uniref:Uncharacterized protein n=1 Tax=Riccia fluitans TaxID=41844 RepID=A0ABD1XMD0_9MARC